MRFLLQGRKIIGSTVPPKSVYIDMLDLAARNGVKPIIERFPRTGGVVDSLTKLNSGKMRNGGVLYAEGH
jgi:D-arabinose 1-dehydrogenase-like Zn-dependent alcohol dehydrogenase